MDVDSGGSGTLYRVVTKVGHSTAAASILKVDIYAWYDNGLTYALNPGTVDQAAVLGAAFDNAGSENLRMHFVWTRATNTFSKLYPIANDETSLQVGSCSSVYDGDGKNITLTFAISPHQQVRATGSSFTEPAGTRYDRAPLGWNYADQSTLAALNTANTWDFKVLVTDIGALTSFACDEFGFFKYTHLSSAGLPGALSGSGAPGSLVTMTPTGHVTFEANCPYKLVAYVDSNLIGASYGQTIFATNMRVQGGDLSATFFSGTGSANQLYVLGTAATFKAPANSGKTTSTSIGTMGQITWSCNIPSVPQDTYTTTITYLLQN